MTLFLKFHDGEGISLTEQYVVAFCKIMGSQE